mgnify:CR=1 FL=1
MAQKYVPGQMIIGFKDSALAPLPNPFPASLHGTPRPLIRRALLLLANVRVQYGATDMAPLMHADRRVVGPSDLPVPGGPLGPALSDFVAAAAGMPEPEMGFTVHHRVAEESRKYIQVTLPESNVRAALEYVRKFPSMVEFAERVPARYFMPFASDKAVPVGEHRPDLPTPLSTRWSYTAMQLSDETQQTWVDKPVTSVAVLDSGYDANHPSLQGAVFPGTTDSGTDPWGHGTAVASIIASRKVDVGNYKLGGGLLPDGKVLMYKVAEEGTPVAGITFPVSFGRYMTVVADLTQRLIANAPANPVGNAHRFPIRVVNMSFGGPACSMTETAVLRQAYEAGLHLVACAGNRDGGADDSVKAWFPAALSSVTSVAAWGTDQKRWTKSKYAHPFRSGKVAVDLAAPGVSIDGAWPLQGANLIQKAALRKFQVSMWLDGTSFAAPFVSAAAALLFEKEKMSSPKAKDIHQLLCGTYTRAVSETGMGSGVLYLEKLTL